METAPRHGMHVFTVPWSVCAAQGSPWSSSTCSRVHVVVSNPHISGADVAPVSHNEQGSPAGSPKLTKAGPPATPKDASENVLPSMQDWAAPTPPFTSLPTSRSSSPLQQHVATTYLQGGHSKRVWPEGGTYPLPITLANRAPFSEAASYKKIQRRSPSVPITHPSSMGTGASAGYKTHYLQHVNNASGYYASKTPSMARSGGHYLNGTPMAGGPRGSAQNTDAYQAYTASPGSGMHIGGPTASFAGYAPNYMMTAAAVVPHGQKPLMPAHSVPAAYCAAPMGRNGVSTGGIFPAYYVSPMHSGGLGVGTAAHYMPTSSGHHILPYPSPSPTPSPNSSPQKEYNKLMVTHSSASEDLGARDPSQNNSYYAPSSMQALGVSGSGVDVPVAHGLVAAHQQVPCASSLPLDKLSQDASQVLEHLLETQGTASGLKKFPIPPGISYNDSSKRNHMQRRSHQDHLSPKDHAGGHASHSHATYNAASVANQAIRFKHFRMTDQDTVYEHITGEKISAGTHTGNEQAGDEDAETMKRSYRSKQLGAGHMHVHNKAGDATMSFDAPATKGSASAVHATLATNGEGHGHHATLAKQHRENMSYQLSKFSKFMRSDTVVGPGYKKDFMAKRGRSVSMIGGADRSVASSIARGGDMAPELHQCEQCGKIYKHQSCLLKHRWEHSEFWNEAKKYSLTKHQQVQIMEAAQMLLELDKHSISS